MMRLSGSGVGVDPSETAGGEGENDGLTSDDFTGTDLTSTDLTNLTHNDLTNNEPHKQMNKPLTRHLEQAARCREKQAGGIKFKLIVILLLIVVGAVFWYDPFGLIGSKALRNKLFSQTVPTASSSNVSSLPVNSSDSDSPAPGAQTIAEQVTDFAARLAAVEQTLKNNQQDPAFIAFQQQTQAELEDLRRRTGTTDQHLLYAEVEYLIRMANQRLLMERDPASALTLLRTADSIIADSGRLTAHALREALARDMAALSAVANLDVEDIYLQLSAAISQVSALRRHWPTAGTDGAGMVLVSGEQGAGSQGDDPSRHAPQPQASGQWFFAFFQRLGGKLIHLVDFRKGAPQVKPLLPPKEEYYLRQNLILKFQVAQMALLANNQAVYHTSLTEAHDWVADWFDESDAGTQTMLAAVARLQEVKVGEPLPEMSDSLLAARNLLTTLQAADLR